MSFERIVGIGFCLLVSADVATGQAPGGARSQTPATLTVTERAHPTGAPAPSRKVEARNQSGSREVVVETLEVPDVDGRWAPTQEIVTETDRGAPNERARRDVFVFDANGRRTLLETTESVRQVLPGGGDSLTRDTLAADLNGHVSLTARWVEETRALASAERESQSTLLLPDPNEPLRAAERTAISERVVSPGRGRRDRTQLVRDVNGRWRSVEVLRGEAREMGNERVEEQAIEHPDINGKLVVDERSVSRQSTANGQEQSVIETYVPYRPGSANLVVRQRIHKTTTTATDGSRSTVEEVESRSLGNPSDPTRVTGRTVTTVRRIGERLVTDRQVFERDVNGRMRLIMSDTEDRVER